MRRPSVLLRVLLSLALILNGSGYAAASMHVAGAAFSMAHAESVGDAVPATCHEATPMAAHVQHADVDLDTSMVEHAPGHPGVDGGSDCCQSGICECACVHVATAAVAALLTREPPVAGTPSRSLQLGHPAPALANPIRPPIG